MTTALRHWQALHRWSSGTVGTVALLHCAMTAVIYDRWGPDALWFLGSGMALLLSAAMNLAHVGFGAHEPCRQPTAPVLRWANWVLFAFGVAALAAISEPQAVVIVLGLGGQAVASAWTLKNVVEGSAEGL
jgi:hypothetical protein